MKTRTAIFVSLGLLIMAVACSRKPQAPAPKVTRVSSNPGARVFIVAPKNGETVTSPVTIRFGIEGIELAKAGEVKSNSGHHHLLVDMESLPPMDQPLPFNEHILHFGQAQTEASINLIPGGHTLQLILAAGNHIPHDPPVISEKIRVTVK